jgi:hypothetical protein
MEDAICPLSVSAVSIDPSANQKEPRMVRGSFVVIVVCVSVLPGVSLIRNQNG